MAAKRKAKKAPARTQKKKKKKKTAAPARKKKPVAKTRGATKKKKPAAAQKKPAAAKRASARLSTPGIASQVQAQVALLGSREAERREDALLRLLDLADRPGWPDVRDPLSRLAQDPAELPALRAGAVRLLCSAGWVSEGLALLGSFLGDPDPALRWRAVATLLQFDPFPRDVVERALIDPAPEVRLQAAYGLSERDRGFDPLPIVLGVLRSDAPEDRVEGLKTLVALGPDRARPALEAVRRLLADPDQAVQAFANGAVAVLDA